MQPLLAPPRDGLTEAQVRAVLTGPGLAVGFGAELVTPGLSRPLDISVDVAAWTVSHDNTAQVHGTVSLQVARELAWGRDLIRPYMILAGGGVSTRWNLGVYVMTSPDTKLGESPRTYQVSGFDQLYLLQSYVGDSWHVGGADDVLGAVRAALTAAGFAGAVSLDSSAAGATLGGAGKTWPMLDSAGGSGSSGPTRWIDVATDLLKAVGYGPLWCDWDGAMRSGPYVDPAVRPLEWIFSVADPLAGVVEPDRSVASDVWGVPNRWVFYANGLDGAPVDGASRFEVDNLTTGVTSQTSLGRVVTAQPQGLDAASYGALVTQGTKIAADASRVPETITATLSPFPVLWHDDVALWSDRELGTDRRVRGVSWSLAHDGSGMTTSWETVA